MRVATYILAIVLLSSLFISCKRPAFEKEKYGNCSDKIKNQKEEDVDCGGECLPCASCDDGIKNNNETGVDCGGSCTSCTPNCTIPSSICNYTFYPPGLTSSTSVTSNIYSASYVSNTSEINISFSSGFGYLTTMRIYLNNNFNPITYLTLNQTMVIKTIDYSNSATKDSQAKITYSGNFGFSSFSGSMDANQFIYITKTTSTKVNIRFCNLTAGNNRFNLNATTL
jgi:hypothetical protein